MKTPNSIFRFFCTAFFLLMFTFALVAQTTNGNIVGAVTDQNGAALPNVTVTVTNTETNQVRTVTTDEEGNYTAPNLAIGTYQISAELTGFKRTVLSAIQLVVNQTARLDIQLETGNVNEQVTVEASAPLIESERSEVAQVIENKTIVQLPLNGRNFIRLGSLIPGTTRGAPGNTIVASRQGGEALTSNGQRAEHNNYTLDGVDNNETLFGAAVVVPSIDAIQEFKVQTANYSAEFGRGAGAIVNVALKSGTNRFSGALFEFVRNDKLDARNPFFPARTPLRRNQFGVSIGGPVILPRFGEGGDPIINLRDRTFFFFNYEGLRERRGFTNFSNVPTAAQRLGNFGSTTILDPTNVVNGVRQPFANNQIPVSRINPISLRVLSLLPASNATNPLGNFAFSGSNPLDNNQVNVRGDHRFSDTDTLFVRYSQTDSTNITRAINFDSTTQTINTKGVAAGYTKVITPTVVNDLRVGFQRYDFSQLPEEYGTNGAALLGLPTFATDAAFFRYPTFNITGQARFGGNAAIPLVRGEDSYQVINNLSLTLGRQNIKIGGDFRHYRATNFQPQFTAGEYFFSASATARTGNALADFLLGLPSQQRVLNTTGFDSTRLRNNRLNLYVQDDFQVSNRLTVNLGLRYERDGAWTEANDRFGYFDFNTGQVVYPRSAQTPFTTFPYPFRFEDLDSIRPARGKQFAPRVGFAFRPFADGKTVVRAAYGVFWGQPIANVFLNTAFTPPPFSLQQNLVGNNLQFGVFPGVTPQTLIPTNPSFFTIQPEDYDNSYVQQWNVGVEREVGFNTAVKISYVGSKGSHLERRFDANAAPPFAPANPPLIARRPFPNFNAIQRQESSASNSYHSLQISGEKRFTDGFLFLAGYTYSKSLDDVSSWTGLGTQESAFPQNPFNLRAERGRSAYDLRHRFTLSAVYELPFRSENRLVDALVGGFQLSGILTLQTGYPFNVFIANTDTANVTGTATANSRLNVISDPFENVPDGYFFNPNAFAVPATGTFGSAGRNFLSGPGSQQLDFSILKVFRFTENTSLQLRGEAFNVLNRPVFGLPDGNFANNAATIRTFGRLINSDNRELQLGIKFLF